MPQVLDLASLQEHDDALARLEGELDGARAELGDDEALEAARAAASEAETRCTGLERDQRRLENETDALLSRIEREEARLYDGSVGLPKELANIQQEVASLRARLSRVEDTELELLDTLETAQAEREEARAALAREERASEEKRARLEAAIARLEGAIETAGAQREACAGRLAPTLVAQYEDLRRRKNGVAVTRMEGNICTGCRVNVPPAARKRARDPETPALCPNCERILVGL